MYYALKFVKNRFGMFTVRACRSRPYSKLDSAIAAVNKSGEGYVKKLGVQIPIYSKYR